MGEYSEAFVAFDVAKTKHAVAIADGGRGGEVRFVGDMTDVTPLVAAGPVRNAPIQGSLPPTRGTSCGARILVFCQAAPGVAQ
jgi:hypothetical protein